MKTLTLTAYWRPRNAAPGEFQETFPVRFATRRYEQSPWVPERVREPRRYDNESAARLLVGRIRRVVEFMDVTELKPSRRLYRLFPWGKGLPAYADHTLLWHDGEKRLLMTTEPYGRPQHLGAPAGWRVLAMPPGHGLWMPLDPDGYVPTEFIWLTPIDGGMALKALAERLMLAKVQQEVSSLPIGH